MSSKKVKEIRVGLVFGSQRFSAKYPSSFSVWEMLVTFERQNKVALTSSSDPLGTWFIPILNIGDRKLDSLFLLCQTLRQLRIQTKGGVLINVSFQQSSFKLTDLPMQLEEARMQVQAKFVSASASTSPLSSPPTEKMDIDDPKKGGIQYPDLAPGKTQNTSRDFNQKCGAASRKLYDFLSQISDPKEFEVARKTTRAIVKNLKKKDEKFSRFKKTHPAIQQKVLRHPGAEEYFMTVGFRNFEDDYFGFQPNLHPDEVDLYIDGLIRDCENSRYVPPKQAIPDVDLSMKVWTRDVLRQRKTAYNTNKPVTNEKSIIAKAYGDLKQKRDLLYPKELMSEALRKKKLGIVDRKYGSTMIHVEFPSGLILEGHFHPANPVQKLREYIYSNLRPEAQPFPFQISIPPNTILKDDTQTFKQIGLVPAGIVRFRGEVASQLKFVLHDRVLERVDKSEYSPVPTALNAKQKTQKATKKKKNAFAKSLLRGKR